MRFQKASVHHETAGEYTICFSPAERPMIYTAFFGQQTSKRGLTVMPLLLGCTRDKDAAIGLCVAHERHKVDPGR